MLPTLLFVVGLLAVMLFFSRLHRSPGLSFALRLRLLMLNPELGAVTLAEAKQNTVTPVDVQVIDEFRKESAILDTIQFDDIVSANPGGGGVISHTYRRLKTQPLAGYRAINTEYTPTEVTTEKVTTDLAVLGGSFQVDRVVAKLGPEASGSVTLNLEQKIKATRTFFQSEVINGDSDLVEEGFDGLDKILTGTTTEMDANGADWTTVSSVNDSAHQALDLLDLFLGLLDGPPTMVMTNQWGLAKMRSVARRAQMHTVSPVDGLLGPEGRPITRERYGNVLLVDLGERAGTNLPIIPVYDPDNAVWSITIPAGADGGTYTLLVTVGDDEPIETGDIAWNANAAAIDTAITTALDGAAGDVTVSGTTVTFAGAHIRRDVSVAVGEQAVTDGGVPLVVTVAETGNTGGLTDLYAARFALDGFHGLSTVGGQIVETFLPQFRDAAGNLLPGAVKTGEVEMGPVAPALKATKAAAVLRGVRVR